MSGPETAFVALTAVVSLAPRRAWQAALQLPAGATLGDARRAIEAQLAHEREALAGLRWGVWGRAQPPGLVLRDGDRVEAWRSLKVDPKLARRERFARQGSRGAGLFAKRPAEGGEPRP